MKFRNRFAANNPFLHILHIFDNGGIPGGIQTPPEIPKFWQSWAEIVLKYQKLRNFYYMKWNFLYQITAASRTPD
jgi:hypothetical protein